VIRRLVWLFLLLAGWLLLRRASSPSPAPRSRTLRDEGSMVRDRICETFLPRSRAILLLRDGQEHFFCSEDCRSRFVAGTGTAR
jgi:YHS domain-containing protein